MKAILLMLAGVSLALTAGPVAIVNAQSRKPDPLTKAHPRENDDPLARLKALRKTWGKPSAEAAQHVMMEEARQRAQHPARYSGTLADQTPAAPAVPVWNSIGPTSANFEQNAVTLNVGDNGRVRTILPHPTDTNIVYVLSSGGGQWKTSNFLSSPTTWTPKTDFIGSTSGGSVAFGRDRSTLYLGTGDPFDVGVAIRQVHPLTAPRPAIIRRANSRVKAFRMVDPAPSAS